MTAKEARHLAENANDIKRKIKDIEGLINQTAISGGLNIEIKEGIPQVIIEYFTSNGFTVETYSIAVRHTDKVLMHTKISW